MKMADNSDSDREENEESSENEDSEHVVRVAPVGWGSWSKEVPNAPTKRRIAESMEEREMNRRGNAARANDEYRRQAADIALVLECLNMDDGYLSSDGCSGGVEEEEIIAFVY